MNTVDKPSTPAALGRSGELRSESSRSLWGDAWRRLRRNRFAMVGGGVILLFIVMALAAPLIAPFDPVTQDYENLRKSPSLEHPFGTDEFGRDILSRVIFGARISLRLGFLGTLFGVALGILIGIVAGFYGGWVDTLTMRSIDIQLAFPGLILAIGIIAVLGHGEINVIIAIGIFSMPTFARVLRGSILSLKEQEFIVAGRAIGANNRRLMFGHLLPNALTPILIIATLRLGTSILTAAYLSFLGLGVRPPSPEWGAMLSTSREFIQLAPHITIFPGLAILITVLAINLLGDGLRDALDPKLDTSG